MALLTAGNWGDVYEEVNDSGVRPPVSLSLAWSIRMVFKLAALSRLKTSDANELLLEVPGVSEGGTSETAIEDNDAVDARRPLFTELAGKMLGSVTSKVSNIQVVNDTHLADMNT